MKQQATAVLFVHGIQGQPKQFRFLTEALPPEAEARAILLPGHGQGIRAFHASGRAQWLRAVEEETRALLDRGFRVVYVGHSMGCLLGLRVSRSLGHPYAGMLLLGCPFRVRPWDKSSSSPEGVEDPRRTAAREGNSVPVHGFRERLLLLHPYAELLRLMGQVRRQRPKGPAGVQFWYSQNDEVVSLRSIKTAQRWPGVRVEILEGCGHCYFTEEARAKLIAAMKAML